MSLNIRKILYIFIISTIIAGIISCENISTPQETHTELSIKSEKKWSLDLKSNDKLFISRIKEFDIKGNLVFLEEYNSNGTINSNSTYNYNSENKSQETKKVFNPDGTSRNITIEYTYNELKKITKKVEYDSNGIIFSTHEYQYDSNGNLIKKFEISQNGGSVSVDYNYTYNPQGDLVERKIINNGAVVNRDSLSYNSSNNSFDVINLDLNGLVESKTTFYYNKRGEINLEIETSSSGLVLKKYLYEYTYYTK